MSFNFYSSTGNINLSMEPTIHKDNYYRESITKDLNFFKKRRYSLFENQLKSDPTFRNADLYSSESLNKEDENESNVNNYNYKTSRDSVINYAEQELDPYFSKMKKELEVQFLNYKKQLSNYDQIDNEIKKLKQKNEENEIEFKLNQDKNNKNFNEVGNKFNELLLQTNKQNHLIKELNKKIEKMENNFDIVNEVKFHIDDINDKIEDLEKNQENYNKNIDEHVKKNININSELKIDSLYEQEINKLRDKVYQLEIEKSNMKSEIESLNTLVKDEKSIILEYQNNLKRLAVSNEGYCSQLNILDKKLQNTNITLNKICNEYLSIGDMNKINNENVNNFTNGLLNTNNNIETLNNKITNLQSNSNFLQNELNTLNDVFKNIKKSISTHSDIINELKIKVNNNAIIESLNENINKLKINLDQVTDNTNGKINSINNRIVEISNNMKKIDIEPINEKFNNLVNYLENNLLTIRNCFIQNDEQIKEIKSNKIAISEENINNSDISKINKRIELLIKNHKNLVEDTKKGFNENSKWHNDIQNETKNAIESLKKEIETIFNEINNNKYIEIGGSGSNVSMNEIRNKFVDKISFDNLNNKLNIIENTLNNLIINGKGANGSKRGWNNGLSSNGEFNVYESINLNNENYDKNKENEGKNLKASIKSDWD